MTIQPLTTQRAEVVGSGYPKENISTIPIGELIQNIKNQIPRCSPRPDVVAIPTSLADAMEMHVSLIEKATGLFVRTTDQLGQFGYGLVSTSSR